MAIFNTHSRLNSFYHEKVRLREEGEKLRGYRDLNVERVKNGTQKINEGRKVKHPSFISTIGQGSMAMHTANRAQNDDDHDIDHALIYAGSEAYADPAKMRQLVADAVCQSGAPFKTEPEARTNATTVWYEDGYHVDFAIYKLVERQWGDDEYYHAGKTWTKRNPQAITDWFIDAVKEKSPDVANTSVTVDAQQLRRVVRLLKFWARSRDGWSLPGGLVLSALAVECYRSHSTRDDVSFIETLEAIRARLRFNTDVYNPTDRTLKLNTADYHNSQIAELTSKLALSFAGLVDELTDPDCGEDLASKAWKKFFRNGWWQEDLNKAEAVTKLAARKSNAASVWKPLKVEIEFYKRPNSLRVKYDPYGRKIIPKGMKILFHAVPNVSGPYSIAWTVKNSGDEARWKNSLEERPGIRRDEDADLHYCEEESAFRGNHLMICEIRYGAGMFYQEELEIRIR